MSLVFIETSFRLLEVEVLKRLGGLAVALGAAVAVAAGTQ
jgi:hypothetical protein